jgi:hypothetical protein
MVWANFLLPLIYAIAARPVSDHARMCPRFQVGFTSRRLLRRGEFENWAVISLAGMLNNWRETGFVFSSQRDNRKSARHSLSC